MTTRTMPLRSRPFCGGDAWMERFSKDMWVFCHDMSDGCILNDTDIEDLAVFSDEVDDFMTAWNRRVDATQ